MVRTLSNLIPLGTKIKFFKLFDPIAGDNKSLDKSVINNATVIMFICNHCPFVKHINKELVYLAQDYIPKNISFFAINSNDVKSSPEDSPEKMKEVSKVLNYPFPYLFDETQEVAKAYNASCTPDFFIFDKNKKLSYHGQLDNSRPDNNIPVTGIDIRNVLNSLLKNGQVSMIQKPSIGCNIKWKNTK